MMFALLLVALFAGAKGAGTLDAAERYIAMTVAAHPDEAEDLTQAASELSNPADYPEDYTLSDQEEYDFIVVGAGSAGSVVANRLTEVDGWTCLLVEYGGDPIVTAEVPALFPSYINTTIDWAYRTKPDGISCLGMNGNYCSWPRGKVLGGSSSFGFTFYERGNRRDYDQWEAEGCTGWGYDDVLEYFKKSEDMRSDEVLAFSPEYHSTGGNLHVEEYVSYAEDAFYEQMKKGFKELGYDSLPENNGFNQTGFNREQGTMIDGRRCSTAKGFLTPIITRANLKVTKNTLATKILFDEENNAYGLELTKNGKKFTVKARKEVILSAGVINSAQLLMLSGVGPREHLESLNVDVLADLPVGENVQDHPILLSLVFTSNFVDLPETPEESMYNFLMKKPSMLSHTASNAYNGFITLTDDPDWPHCTIATVTFPTNGTSVLDAFYTEVIGLRDDLQKQIRDLNQDSYVHLPVCTFMRPYGRGKIELKSTDPLEHPVLTTPYFENEKDLELMLKYFDFVEKLVETDALKSINATLFELKVPKCDEKYTYKSRDYRVCSLQHFTSTPFHQVGSCKMGASDDDTAVVDPTLKVKGVTGLRVIDASIMPTIVNGFTNAAAIMIGEKGADFVKESWQNTTIAE